VLKVNGFSTPRRFLAELNDKGITGELWQATADMGKEDGLMIEFDAKLLEHGLLLHFPWPKEDGSGDTAERAAVVRLYDDAMVTLTVVTSPTAVGECDIPMTMFQSKGLPGIKMEYLTAMEYE